MSAPIFSVADFLSAFQKLMPRGPVWSSDPNSFQSQTETGLISTWQRINKADADLLIDAFPATAVFLLPEWEAALGLPDPCAGPAATVAQRQQQVVSRLTNSGGQSSAYFIALALSLGYVVTTTMFAPFRAGQSHAGDPLGGPWSFFTWQINAPLNTIQFFTAGFGRAGDPLESWGNTVLECEIAAVAPAHTVVQFSYS